MQVKTDTTKTLEQNNKIRRIKSTSVVTTYNEHLVIIGYNIMFVISEYLLKQATAYNEQKWWSLDARYK